MNRWDRAEREYLEPPDDDGVECSKCDGTGKDEPEECGSCDGTGGHWVAADHDPEPCEDCESTGKHTPECTRCEGHGQVSKSFERREREEDRADYEYQQYKDRKAEGEF